MTSGSVRHVQVEVQPGEADDEADDRTDDRDGEVVASAFGGDDDDRGSDERRNGVEPGAENHRGLAQQDVSQHAAADARDRTEDNSGDGVDMMIERGARAGDAEERETRCVKDEDRTPEPFQLRRGEKRDQTRGPRNGEVAPVAERLRWDPDQ